MAKKILFSLGIFVLFLFLFLAGVRFYNEIKYWKNQPTESFPFQDMNAYPKTLEGCTVTKINTKEVKGFLLMPKHRSKAGLVVALGGSEGSCNFWEGAEIVREGVPVICAFYFGQEGQPKTLSEVPLECFSQVLSYAQEQGIPTHPLTVVGASKGAEMGLLLASKYPAVDQVILMAPSSRVFQGLDMKKQTSSWMYEGKDVPYLSFREGSVLDGLKLSFDYLTKKPISYRPTYLHLIEKHPQKSLIDVKSFKGQGLLLCGEDDAMWPSAQMAQEIVEQNPTHFTKIVYRDAGHIFNISSPVINGLEVGGTSEGNQRAMVESHREISRFIQRYHAPL